MSFHPRQLAAGAVAISVMACGAGPATVHPAHAIHAGQVVLGAGVSGNFAFGDAKTKTDRANALAPGADTSEAEQVYVDGAISRAMTGPGVSPWAGGRIGLGSDSEAELTYAGRTVRIGARHAFENGHGEED